MPLTNLTRALRAAGLSPGLITYSIYCQSQEVKVVFDEKQKKQPREGGKERRREGGRKIKTEMGLERLKEGHLERCCRYVDEVPADKRRKGRRRRRRKEADKRRRIRKERRRNEEGRHYRSL